jgi:hypothetical protein
VEEAALSSRFGAKRFGVPAGCYRSTYTIALLDAYRGDVPSTLEYPSREWRGPEPARVA